MTEKVRVHEIAKELGIASKDVVKKASEIGIEIKSASSSVSMQEAESLMNYIMSGEHAEAPKSETKVEAKSISDAQKEEKSPKEEVKKSEVKTPAKKGDTQTKESSVIEKSEEEIEPKVKIQDENVEKDDNALLTIADPKKMLIKKSGLTIVKKKQPKIEEKNE